jgi:hypothetical protein
MLGECILQVASQLRPNIADKESNDAMRTFGDKNGPEGRIAVAETEGLRHGHIGDLRCHGGTSFLFGSIHHDPGRGGTPPLAFKLDLEVTAMLRDLATRYGVHGAGLPT